MDESRQRSRTCPRSLSGWTGVRVAIENGTHSGWISRTLEQAGCMVWVANPSRWRGTAHSSKNDANDAEALARVVRVDPKLLFPITHRSQQQQEDLSVIRIRAQLVRARTMLVNTARGAVKSVGSRLPATDADAFHNTSGSPYRRRCAKLYVLSIRRSLRSRNRCVRSTVRSKSFLKRSIRRRRCFAVF